MERNEFYDFSSQHRSSYVMVLAVNLKYGEENEIDDRDRLFMGDYTGLSFPIVFKHYDGKKWCDVLGTGWVSLYLISERLKRILEEHCFTGWQTFPVKVLTKKGEEVPGYHGFSVIGRGGKLSCKRSTLIEKRYVPHGPLIKLYKGLYFDSLDKWDGNDFFKPGESSRRIIVTQRVVDVLTEYKITNVHFTNLSDEEIDVSDAHRYNGD